MKLAGMKPFASHAMLTPNLLCKQCLVMFKTSVAEYPGRWWQGQPETVDYVRTACWPSPEHALRERLDEYEEKRIKPAMTGLALQFEEDTKGSVALIFAGLLSPSDLVTVESYWGIRMAFWLDGERACAQIAYSVARS